MQYTERDVDAFIADLTKKLAVIIGDKTGDLTDDYRSKFLDNVGFHSNESLIRGITEAVDEFVYKWAETNVKAGWIDGETYVDIVHGGGDFGDAYEKFVEPAIWEYMNDASSQVDSYVERNRGRLNLNGGNDPYAWDHTLLDYDQPVFSLEVKEMLEHLFKKVRPAFIDLALAE